MDNFDLIKAYLSYMIRKKGYILKIDNGAVSTTEPFEATIEDFLTHYKRATIEDFLTHYKRLS